MRESEWERVCERASVRVKVCVREKREREKRERESERERESVRERVREKLWAARECTQQSLRILRECINMRLPTALSLSRWLYLSLSVSLSLLVPSLADARTLPAWCWALITLITLIALITLTTLTTLITLINRPNVKVQDNVEGENKVEVAAVITVIAAVRRVFTPDRSRCQ